VCSSDSPFQLRNGVRVGDGRRLSGSIRPWLAVSDWFEDDDVVGSMA
jgi:hypothetical protein